jgi:hypothetical protein
MAEPQVSDTDRSVAARQAAALDAAPATREPDERWWAALITWADADRAQQGSTPLKTETELHRRAVALGLRRPGA